MFGNRHPRCKASFGRFWLRPRKQQRRRPTVWRRYQDRGRKRYRGPYQRWCRSRSPEVSVKSPIFRDDSLGYRAEDRTTIERQTTHKQFYHQHCDEASFVYSQSALAIDALKTSQVARTLCLLVFNLDSSLHHGNHILRVSDGTATFKASDRPSGFFQTSVTHEPPGRFRREPEDADQGNRPCPLNSKGDLVRPLLSDAPPRTGLRLTLVVPFRKPYKIPAVSS